MRALNLEVQALKILRRRVTAVGRALDGLRERLRDHGRAGAQIIVRWMGVQVSAAVLVVLVGRCVRDFQLCRARVNVAAPEADARFEEHGDVDRLRAGGRVAREYEVAGYESVDAVRQLAHAALRVSWMRWRSGNGQI